jgi:hypothetical protein
MIDTYVDTHMPRIRTAIHRRMFSHVNMLVFPYVFKILLLILPSTISTSRYCILVSNIIYSLVNLIPRVKKTRRN